MDDLGIEFLTSFCLPPIEFVDMAANLGCRHISLMPRGNAQFNPLDFPVYSLRDDPQLRARTIAALKDRGVSPSLGEGYVVFPGTNLADDLQSLDVMAELGVTLVNTVSLDPDLPRSLDQFAWLAEAVAERGMQTTTEFAPSLTITNLQGALDAVRYVGRPDFKLLIDTMHLIRAGNTAPELAAVDPAQIGYVQLSDHRLTQRGETYNEDTMDRMVPGEGELPLIDILSVIPPDVIVSVEVPMQSRIAAGDTVEQCVKRAVDGARQVVAAAAAARAAAH